MQTETTQRKLTWWGVNILVLLYALVPVLWILSLSLKDAATLNDGKFLPVSPTGDNYTAIFSNPDFLRALINSIGIGLIATVIAVVFGDDGRLRHRAADLPGQDGDRRRVAADRDVPADLAGDAAVQHRGARIGLFDTWPGLIIPYITFALPLAIYTLSAFFREIPWDLEKAAKMDGATPSQAFRKVIAPLAAPGIVHHGDPGLHLRAGTTSCSRCR